jgi:hypothetical protein
VSAVCRLMPKPPARVDSTNTNLSLPSLLKSAMRSSRSYKYDDNRRTC